MRVIKEETNDSAIRFRKLNGASGTHVRDGVETSAKVPRSDSLQVSLLTGGCDRPYALPLAMSLIAEGVALDFIGSDQLEDPELNQSSLLRFLNLRGDMNPEAPAVRKAWRVFVYYLRLIRYVVTAKPKVFHILWHNKFELLDRTLLLLWYRLLGKRIAFTAHNVNAAWRDGNDNWVNRLSLRIQYRLVDHLFVHTEQMKRALQSEYGVSERKISVIPFGINSTVPNTALTCAQARKHLGLTSSQRVLLFFGAIAPYKGLDHLIEAMTSLSQAGPDYRLIIAGWPKNCAPYWESIQQRISSAGLRPCLIERIEWVPDADTEIYFKAADVLVLPYKYIFQSGVLFLAYNFGLPAIASDVGSFKEDIVVGKTGFLCQPEDPVDLKKSIEAYFASELYQQLETRREEIRDYGHEKYSWTKVSAITRAAYQGMLARR